MVINSDKSKYMVINFTRNYQLNTCLKIEENPLEQISQTILLGVIIDERLSWNSNTNHIVRQAYKKMTILRKLFEFSVPIEDLVEIYTLYIRSVVESSAVVWHSSITEGQRMEIERIQKVALRIIMKDDYTCYEDALVITALPTLNDRLNQLCKTFAVKCTKNPKTSDMFPLNDITCNTRNPERYYVTHAKTNRLAKSAIPFMQKLLNTS